MACMLQLLKTSHVIITEVQILTPKSDHFSLAQVAMAQWEKCMRLTGQFLEQLKALYGHRLPIEVRHYLANWMEAQSW